MADEQPGDTPDPRQRIDPLGAAIFGAVAMIYWARCLPSTTCGQGAEALTLRILAALHATEEGVAGRQTVSTALAAAHGAILAHVASLDLPPAAALGPDVDAQYRHRHRDQAVCGPDG